MPKKLKSKIKKVTSRVKYLPDGYYTKAELSRFKKRGFEVVVLPNDCGSHGLDVKKESVSKEGILSIKQTCIYVNCRCCPTKKLEIYVSHYKDSPALIEIGGVLASKQYWNKILKEFLD